MKKDTNSTNYGIWVFLAKMGAKALPLFTKLFKSAKLVKLGLATASFASYAYLLTWQFATAIIVMLFVHESGHVWAMRRKGVRTKGFYFIPFLGGAAVPEESFKSRDTEAYVAIMGPIWGLALSLVVFGYYFINPNPIFAATAGWMAFLNLINLLPINPLDGGRIIKSIILSLGLNSERNHKGVIISLIIVSATILLVLALGGLWLFFVLGILGLFEVIRELHKPSEMKPMTATGRVKYLILTIAVAFSLFMIMNKTDHLPGSDIAMETLRGK